MSNSSLVNVVIPSPNYSKRTKPITKITIHHCAGNLSVETIGNIFKNPSRKASSNYGIGTDGRVGLYVDEATGRAWTSGNAENDQMAVTMEVANDVIGGNWHVSDKAYAKMIDLCVDICQRNGIKQLIWTGNKNGNLTCHYMFQATACPGPYLKSKMQDIANQVNARLRVNQYSEVVDVPVSKFPYLVKIATDVLNVRSGAGTQNKITTTVKRNQIYTIVDEKFDGSWGKLKSGAGWICLAYTTKI